MKSVLHFFRGFFAAFVVCLNTVFWGVPTFIIAAVKFLVPISAVRRLCTRAINVVAKLWADINNFNIRWLLPIAWDISVPEDLSRDRNYLVISNHRSWVDVVVLQMVFNDRIPFFRFFLKSVLIWVPFLGLAWWALDYPFMKRYSKEKLAKHPELKGKDMDSAKRACARYAREHVSIMNFPEGTRYNERKKISQKSAFSRLLKPKAGGIAYVLSAMGNTIDSILNVTIVYYDDKPSLWKFLRGDIARVSVRVEKIEVTANLLGDYSGDESFRASFQQWLNQIWKKKDAQIGQLLER